jgi:hypothetical protein
MNPLSDKFMSRVKIADVPRLYLDISKLINENCYLLINIPEVSAKRSAYELGVLTGESAGPIKTPFGYEVGRGQYTINWMINNYGVTPFEFYNWKDSVEVAELITEYVDQLTNREDPLTEEETAYLLKASEFGAKICEIAKRLISVHGIKNLGKSIFDQHKTQKLKDILEGRRQAELDKMEDVVSTTIPTRGNPALGRLTRGN